jgi:uncharacterized protein YukE
MYTITKAIKEIISEVEADSKNWQGIAQTEHFDEYYGEHEALEERKLWGYNERIKTSTANLAISALLDMLEQAFDLADDLEVKQIIQK